MNKLTALILDGKEYVLADEEARSLIADRTNPDQVNELIKEYHLTHPETDPTVGAIPLAELTELFN